MSYILHTDIKAKSVSYGSNRSSNSIKYLVYHYTGNKNDTACANAKYFANTNTRPAGAHYFVDEKDVYQSIDDLKVAWAVGGSKYSNCNITGGGKMYGIVTNSNSISIEMCSTNGKFSDATIENAIELGQKIMIKYNIPIKNVYTHFDITGKLCPGYDGWWRDSRSEWVAFKNKLKNSVKSTKSNASTKIIKKIKNNVSGYTFKKFVKDVQKSIGVMSSGIANPKTLANTPTISSRENNKHKVVTPLQKYLNSIGYDCGNVDGVAGEKFNNAIKAFQKDNDCVVDGELTSKGRTWRKILKMM